MYSDEEEDDDDMVSPLVISFNWNFNVQILNCAL